MEYLIRRVRADEWQQVRELRLLALQDPVASIAFLETYENASAKDDSFWMERTEGSAVGERVAQFVAEAPDGSWVGTVSVLVEKPGVATAFSDPAVMDQTHIVGVFVRSEVRGSGVGDALFRAGIEWSWELRETKAERVRLFVHERNGRAEGLYKKLGFERTGVTVPMAGGSGELEIEMAVRRTQA
ncbi:GNAT family N-acetyltransferase [Streptomyces sp. NBC_00237]|uniref:GNAT family N-acetyltransferase n=1 Tax=Streptomyces sp. NBC_00237 TaxID=2975687 RepID=UPI00224CCF4B|nr:GNAT family N-acetyltransferase [Streptomyces sp. NBC_00237]MCX5207229.1 GNAT family N-acetyltransferase [Streptomyces sp. NBC_00237]